MGEDMTNTSEHGSIEVALADAAYKDRDLAGSGRLGISRPIATVTTIADGQPAGSVAVFSPEERRTAEALDLELLGIASDAEHSPTCSSEEDSGKNQLDPVDLTDGWAL
jgi:hypothetical protein